MIKEEEMKRFVEEWKGRAKAIILFGSSVKGLATDISDVDICIISDELPKDIFKRRYLCPSGYKHLSVFGFHPDEFARYLRHGNLFVKEILKGKILFDNGSLKGLIENEDGKSE